MHCDSDNDAQTPSSCCLPSHFPDHGTQFHQLKGLINAVVDELQGMGLNPIRGQEPLSFPKATTESHNRREEVPNVYQADQKGDTISDLQLTTGNQKTTDPQFFPLPNNDSIVSFLFTTLSTIQNQATEPHQNFECLLRRLVDSIGRTARPVHEVDRKKRFYSAVETDPTSVRSIKPHFWLSNASKRTNSRTDLFTWRKLFYIYVQISPFRSFYEETSEEGFYEDSMSRLQILRSEMDRIKPQFRDALSPNAVETFWDLNLIILDIKKYCTTNSEALQKIIEKRAERTSLSPPPGDTISHPSSHPLADRMPSDVLTGPFPTEMKDLATEVMKSLRDDDKRSLSMPILNMLQIEMDRLPQSLVQAVRDRLLVVVPSVDDYLCTICTSLAFKPIRLSCQHLFCVRCLVKMQKRGQGECPLCRKDVVLQAHRSNVDWALLNFMKDWFPEEARAKGRENELEAAIEAQREKYAVGKEPDPPCAIS